MPLLQLSVEDECVTGGSREAEKSCHGRLSDQASAARQSTPLEANREQKFPSKGVPGQVSPCDLRER